MPQHPAALGRRQDRNEKSKAKKDEKDDKEEKDLCAATLELRNLKTFRPP